MSLFPEETSLRVADLARAIGARFGVTPTLIGKEADDALLSNSSRMSRVLDEPLVPVSTLLDWVVNWIQLRGRLLGKLTHFERRDGTF